MVSLVVRVSVRISQSAYKSLMETENVIVDVNARMEAKIQSTQKADVLANVNVRAAQFLEGPRQVVIARRMLIDQAMSLSVRMDH